MDIQAERTEVNVGDDVKLSLSMHNSLAQPRMTVSMSMRVPSGWNVVLSGEGVADVCTSQCSAVYQIEPARQKEITFSSVANQAGQFYFRGRLEWFFGDDRSQIHGEDINILVTVSEPPTPTPTPTITSTPTTTSTPTNTPVPPAVAPPPITRETEDSGGIGCGLPASDVSAGAAAANMLFLLGPLGLTAALKMRRRRRPPFADRRGRGRNGGP